MPVPGVELPTLILPGLVRWPGEPAESTKITKHNAKAQSGAEGAVVIPDDDLHPAEISSLPNLDVCKDFCRASRADFWTWP